MWGVGMAGEGKERKIVEEMVQSKVQGEEVLFSFPRPKKSGEEVRVAALVYVGCLKDQIVHLLEENKS